MIESPRHKKRWPRNNHMLFLIQVTQKISNTFDIFSSNYRVIIECKKHVVTVTKNPCLLPAYRLKYSPLVDHSFKLLTEYNHNFFKALLTENKVHS